MVRFASGGGENPGEETLAWDFRPPPQASLQLWTMKIRSSAVAVFLLGLSAGTLFGGVELISVEKIWDRAPHSAFTDLVRHRGRWFCTFREGAGHIPVIREGKQIDGVIRVLSSPDGREWTSAALLSEDGIDLRDPHFAVMPDGRLMLVAGGSRYAAGKYVGRQPRVAFSADGVRWSAPQAIMEDGDWLWRVLWHKGQAFGINKRVPGRNNPAQPKRGFLVRSTDGIHWTNVVELEVPGIDEAALVIDAHDEMMVLARRGADNNHGWFGRSRPPYTRWTWQDCGEQVGGPNLILIPGKGLWAGTRSADRRTCLAAMIDGRCEPKLFLPSGGDNSYPGFWWQENQLWISYYSSHEGKTSIYLAKVRIN